MSSSAAAHDMSYNGFFSDKGQLEFWHLGHLLEQCMALFKQRTGAPALAITNV